MLKAAKFRNGRNRVVWILVCFLCLYKSIIFAYMSLCIQIWIYNLSISGSTIFHIWIYYLLYMNLLSFNIYLLFFHLWVWYLSIYNSFIFQYLELLPIFLNSGPLFFYIKAQTAAKSFLVWLKTHLLSFLAGFLSFKRTTISIIIITRNFGIDWLYK